MLGHAGDLLLAHYLLGHNTGGNTSAITRETVYFRLRREGHRDRWRDFVQEPLLEFDTVAQNSHYASSRSPGTPISRRNSAPGSPPVT